MAKPRVHRTALPVKDIDAAAKFYSKLLDNSGKRISPDRHYYDLGGFILALYQPAGGGSGWSFETNQYFYLSAADLDDMRRKVTEGGGKCLTENAKMPWGETMFFATDPSGSRIGICREDSLFSLK
jgi:predicted enzyme related to lactoylglutathione lyase